MVNYKIPTRIKDKNKFLYNRPACPLPDNGLLPTKADVDLAIEFKLETLAVTQKMSNGVVQKVILEVVRELEAIWGRLVPSIQLQDFHNIVRKVKRMRIDRQSELSFVGQYNDLKRRKGKFRSRKGQNTYKISNEKLFDLSSASQTWSRIDKVFYDDQVSERSQRREFSPRGTSSGSSDRTQSKSPPPDIPSPESATDSTGDVGDVQDNLGEVESEVEEEDSVSESESESSDDEDDLTVRERRAEKGKKSERGKGGVDVSFSAGARYNISTRALTQLQPSQSPGASYSKSGLHKARMKAEQEAVMARRSENETLEIVCIGFDEKTDDCLKPYNKFGKEEHCAVVGYFADGTERVLGHFTTPNSSGKGLAQGLHAFLLENRVNLDCIKSLSSDGCPKMLGHEGGAHAVFERLVGRSLLRVVCIFHHVEKVFKGLASYHGYETSGPATVKGDWKGELEGDLHLLPLAKFPIIRDDGLKQILDGVPYYVRKELSNDYKNLLDLVKVVITGKDDLGAAKRKCGAFHKARFITTQNRMVRLYLSTEKPSLRLKRTVHFVVKVFLPVILEAKIHHTEYVGPQIILKEVMLSRQHLTKKEFEAVHERISYNGSFAHPENVLLGLLNSQLLTERSFGVETLLKIRESTDSTLIRQFHSVDHRPNPQADSLMTLCTAPFTSEPPVTKSLSDEEVKNIVNQPLSTKLPMTTVAVERLVKEVSRVSTVCVDELRRDGKIFLSIQNRNGN